MSTLESFKDIYFEFFKSNYDRYLLRNWIYKNKTYVSDLYFEGYHLAFDLKYDDEFYILDRVVRNYNNKDKFFSEKKVNLIKAKDVGEIISTLDTYLRGIKDKIDSSYDYKISVIIPVYNREQLISKCIASLNNQKLDKSEFEVIFVDDYSSDKSVEIIEKTVDKKLNYKILKRPINSGSASAPRNDGILASRGKYIYFLDSDDYIYNYTLLNMLSCAEKNNSELVYAKYDGDKGRAWGRKPFFIGNIGKANVVRNHLVRSLMSSKLIRSYIIKNDRIFYPLDIKVGEDRVFMMSILTRCQNVSILADKPYYYITNHDFGRITNSGLSLGSDLKINYLIINDIVLNARDRQRKIELISSWMNVLLESYIGLRARNKTIALVEKKNYLDDLFNIVCHHLNYINSSYIYAEYIPLYELFINKKFEECVALSVAK